jgi:hypothetical protein
MVSTKEIAKEGLQRSVFYFLGYFLTRLLVVRLSEKSQKTVV